MNATQRGGKESRASSSAQTAGTMFVAVHGHFTRAMAVPAAILLQAPTNCATFAPSADEPEVTRDQLFDVFEDVFERMPVAWLSRAISCHETGKALEQVKAVLRAW